MSRRGPRRPRLPPIRAPSPLLPSPPIIYENVRINDTTTVTIITRCHENGRQKGIVEHFGKSQNLIFGSLVIRSRTRISL